MTLVDVNTADPWQLAVLLDLSRPEVEAVLLARPFAAPEAFWRALPARVAALRPALSVPRRDINTATADDLVKAAGVSRDEATRVINGRPYYFDRQLASLAGSATFAKLSPYFATPDLQFVDKLTGQPVALTPDPTRVLVGKSDSESAAATVNRLHLEALFPKAVNSPFTVFSLPDTEDAANTIAQLEQSNASKVIPGFRDTKSSPVFLDPRNCLVQFQPNVPVATQESVISNLGLTIVERHRTPGLYTLAVPQAERDPSALTRAIAALNARPEVKFAEPNFLGFDDLESIGSFAAPAAPTASALPWNLGLVDVVDAWARGRGDPGVILAVVDTGVQLDHPSLAGGILPRPDSESWNFTDDPGPVPSDNEGHGTFIAGLLIGNGELNVQGICPGCRLLPLKIPVQGETNSYARRRDAILFALDRVPPGGRLVMNISWKTTGDVSVIRDALDTAAARGAIIAASAGNFPDQPNEPHFPSDYRSVISVAAVGPTKRRASYSFYGDNVDLSAPGGDNTDPSAELTSAALGGTTTQDVGTSYAAPHVVGLAALLWSDAPALIAAQVRSSLDATASPLIDPGMGKGLISAGAALQAALAAGSGTPPSPPPVSPGTAGAGLVAVNTDGADVLVARFGLLSFTASLLVARRPYARLDDIRGTLGLTDAQFAAIAAA